MAVVRFSQELREAIVGKAKKQFIEQRHSVVKSLPLTYGDTMYHKAFGMYLPIMSQLPDGFMSKRNEICPSKIVMRIKGERNDVHIGRLAGGRVAFRLSSAMPFPEKFPNDAAPKFVRDGYSDYSYVCSADDPQDMEFFELVSDWEAQIQAVQTRANEFISGSFTTLAPALKAWPPLWEYLPEEAQTRHKTVVERKKREQVEADIKDELTKLTSIASAQRIMK
jgi:hypothetical protein